PRYRSTRTVPLSQLRQSRHHRPQSRGHRLRLDSSPRVLSLGDLEFCTHLFPDRAAQSFDGRAPLAVGLSHLPARRATDHRVAAVAKFGFRSIRHSSLRGATSAFTRVLDALWRRSNPEPQAPALDCLAFARNDDSVSGRDYWPQSKAASRRSGLRLLHWSRIS